MGRLYLGFHDTRFASDARFVTHVRVMTSDADQMTPLGTINRMKKWLRGVLYLVAFGLIAAIVATFISYRMTQGAPDWYHPHAISAAERAAAARRADDKFLTAISQAADAQAAEIRAKTRPSVVPQPHQITVSFTAEELNAFFYKWATLNHWDEKVGNYFSDAQIVIHEGRLIVAGTVNSKVAAKYGLGTLGGMVVSFHFRPELTSSGQLDCSLARVMAGRLPLPSAIWDAQSDKLKAFLLQHLPAFQRKAKISDTGASNGDAIAAAMTEFMIDVLDQQPSSPVIFLPVDNRHGIPVKITSIQVADQSISMTAVPLDANQRQGLLRQIKSPVVEQAASGN